MGTRIDVPVHGADPAAAALSAHVGERMRRVDRVTGQGGGRDRNLREVFK